jgi:hypothetical protein
MKLRWVFIAVGLFVTTSADAGPQAKKPLKQFLNITHVGDHVIAPSTSQGAEGRARSVYLGHRLECIAKPSEQRFVNAHASHPLRHVDGTVDEGITVCVDTAHKYTLAKDVAPDPAALTVGTLVYTPNPTGKAFFHLGRIKAVGAMLTVGSSECGGAGNIPDRQVAPSAVRLPLTKLPCE